MMQCRKCGYRTGHLARLEIHDCALYLKVKKMVAAGKFDNQIAAKLGLPSYRVWLILKHIGLLKERPSAGRPRKKCPYCGVKVMMAGHSRKKCNRWKRVRALLGNPCISQTEIAQRLGVSRQRVSDMAGALGMLPGLQRRESCRLEHPENLNQIVHKRMQLAKKRLEQEGLEVQLLKVKQEGNRVYMSSKECFVNGIRCHVRLYTAHRVGQYDRLSMKEMLANGCEFILNLSNRPGTDVGVFVVPAGRFEQKGFTLYLKRRKHPLWDYLNAFEQLKPEQREGSHASNREQSNSDSNGAV